MKYSRHPNFILGIITIILGLIGVGFNSNGYHDTGYNVLVGTVIIGGIHYIWSIIDIVGKNDMKPFQKRFWLISVVSVPILGSMLFYVLHQEKGKIIT